MKRLIPITTVFLLISAQIGPAAVSSDLDFQKTVGSHALIGLPQAQNLGYDGQGQTIVIIDDGTQIEHPYLKGVIIDGNCTSKVVCGSDYLNPGVKAGGAHVGNGFHGSMVAGIIAGQANSNAPGGIAPRAKVISIDNTRGDTEGLLQAMSWVLTVKDKHNVVALSASIGAPNSSGPRGGAGDCSPGSDLVKKIRELIAAGINVVFAAGNGGSLTKLDFPACLPELISVGALTHSGAIAEYSNISQNITVMAPAEIKSSNGDGGYFIGGGTSSATPVVAGAIALLRQANPSATTDEIKKALQTSRRSVDDVIWGNLPVLDIPEAIEAIKSGKFQPRKAQKLAGALNSEQLQATLNENLALKSALARLESDAKVQLTKYEESLSTLKILGRQMGMLVEHKAGCHGMPNETGEQAEVQEKQSDGTWKKVSSLVSWEITSECPSTNPTRWWALVDVGTSAQLRWSFSIGSNPAFNTAEFSFINTVKQLQEETSIALARAESKAQIAEKALAKTRSQLNRWRPTQITCVKGNLVKKVSAVNPRCPVGFKQR
jgi:hypothetical protein